MSAELTPDLCVIGAGSAGLTVAAGAAAFGVSVALVEKGRMGGDCLNAGCVPSKALIAAAAEAEAIRRSSRFGIAAGPPRTDWPDVLRHVRGVIAAIAPNDSEERLTGLGVKVIRAEARFIDRRTVAAGGYAIRARRFLVAAGSSPLVPEIDGLSDVPYLTNETIFDIPSLPGRLIVLGGGAIGLELAQAFRRLGSEVVVVEAAAPLGKDDPELSALVLRRLREEGVAIHAGAPATGVSRDAGGVAVQAECGGRTMTVRGSDLLVAVGRKPNVEGLGLDAAGVRFTPRGIEVDPDMRTSNRRIYAIGDVAGSYQFTHWAGYQGSQVLRSLLFRVGGRVDPGRLVWATYTDPELAQVGLTEVAAREKHRDIRILRWPFSENDRAHTERDTIGLTKVVTTSRGRIVGAGIVGRGAGDLIGLWALAVAKGLSVDDVSGVVFPYPTRMESARRAALAFHMPKLQSPWVKRAVRWLKPHR